MKRRIHLGAATPERTGYTVQEQIDACLNCKLERCVLEEEGFVSQSEHRKHLDQCPAATWLYWGSGSHVKIFEASAHLYGKTQTVSEWCEEFNLFRHAVYELIAYQKLDPREAIMLQKKKQLYLGLQRGLMKRHKGASDNAKG